MHRREQQSDRAREPWSTKTQAAEGQGVCSRPTIMAMTVQRQLWCGKPAVSAAADRTWPAGNSRAKKDALASSTRSILSTFTRLAPVMPRTYHQAQAFCRMLRQRRSEVFDAWITEVQQNGVEELRAFAEGLCKDASAVRRMVAELEQRPNERLRLLVKIAETTSVWARWHRLFAAAHPPAICRGSRLSRSHGGSTVAFFLCERISSTMIRSSDVGCLG
jgi:hypothetical protein